MDTWKLEFVFYTANSWQYERYLLMYCNCRELPEGRTKEVFGALWTCFHKSTKTTVFSKMPFTEEEVEFFTDTSLLTKTKTNVCTTLAVEDVTSHVRNCNDDQRVVIESVSQLLSKRTLGCERLFDTFASR
jgi:hypothetical protein